MQVTLKPDSPVTNEACLAATGKSVDEWIAALEAHPELSGKRREAINWMYEQMNKNAWWPTTVWVEYERKKGITAKDGKAEGYNICVTKTVAASVERTYAAIATNANAWYCSKLDGTPTSKFEDSSGNRAEATRVRENKDLRFTWRTAGSGCDTTVDLALADKGGGKTGITLMHNRIQTRDEADGLRAAWSAAFDRLKASLEAKS